MNFKKIVDTSFKYYIIIIIITTIAQKIESNSFIKNIGHVRILAVHFPTYDTVSLSFKFNKTFFSYLLKRFVDSILLNFAFILFFPSIY